MLQAFARRLREWFGGTQLPIGDVAGEEWAEDGPLPAGPVMGLVEHAQVPLVLRVPPPLPRDARRPPKARDEGDWDAMITITRAKSSHARTGAVPRKATTGDSADTSDWSAVIAAAKLREPRNHG